MKYLNYETSDLEAYQGLLTAREINNQPDLWLKTYSRVIEEKENIVDFLAKALRNKNINIVLTGAGTSAFIGEALRGVFQREFGVPTRAVATTDIITHPDDYFVKSASTLMVSFARSGDSPESVASINFAKKYCDNFYEINITCNSKGNLATKENEENSYVFILPDEANDKALAMTGSYTSMLLAGILIADIKNIEKKSSLVHKIRYLGKHILEKYHQKLWELAQMKIERAVFLGSGPLFGTAQESHLKVQELTCGKVICKFDSFLGFRHGPVAVVDNATVVFYLLSNDLYVRQYEIDLIKSVKEFSDRTKFVCIGDGYHSKELGIDLAIKFLDETLTLPEEYLSVLYVLPAQIFGFYKSLKLDLAPDFPSKNGMITRVVEGVKIYSKNM
ncbi:MAG: SIS domain-containing protein [Chlorobi bacterium]|nr:SIS domain-containing protein [Chlorobiota bacterium]